MRWSIAAFIALGVSAASLASYAADAPAPAEAVADPVTTHHKTDIDGRTILYTATVGETVLKDDAGKPAATIFSTTYKREGGTNLSRRPVVFFFNGGPGSSSDQLHAAFGPRSSSRSIDVGVTASTSGAAAMVPNPYSILDTTDLVFIDPVGTGFSRVLPGGDGAKYWNPIGDKNAMLEFIRDWIASNHRENSPKFIGGESYGGFRLALMLNDAKDLKLNGVIFISPLLDMSGSDDAPGNDLPYILALPTMAADAWYHNRADRGGRTLEETYQAALRFAEGDYAQALLRGSALPDDELHKVAKEEAAWIGLPAQYIVDHELRVPIENFVKAILSDKGLRIGRTDGRYTGNLAELSKNHPPFDDPAIQPGGSVAPLITDYLVNDLKFDTQRHYTTLAMDVNGKWNWSLLPPDMRSYVNATPGIAKAMKDDPGLKLMLVGGYYDLATPMTSTIYAIDHGDIPRDRVTEAFYESGHSIYQHPESHAKLSADVRAFIKSAASGP